MPEERKERAWQAKNARRLLENVRVYMQLISNYDPYTYTHCLEVANYCRKWSPMLGLDEEEQFEVYIAALIHDLGKIYIPRRLLHQEQALNEHDWQVIREHPAAGAKLLIHYEDLDISCIKQYILSHHERYDGKGYPLGLKGEEIPLGARIIAVADAVAAMTAIRPYRSQRLSQAEARRELHEHAGTQFDAEIVSKIIDYL